MLVFSGSSLVEKVSSQGLRVFLGSLSYGRMNRVVHGDEHEGLEMVPHPSSLQMLRSCLNEQLLKSLRCCFAASFLGCDTAAHPPLGTPSGHLELPSRGTCHRRGVPRGKDFGVTLGSLLVALSAWLSLGCCCLRGRAEITPKLQTSPQTALNLLWWPQHIVQSCARSLVLLPKPPSLPSFLSP